MNAAWEKFEPEGLATGIGSLPHTDPGKAVEAILAHTPVCPFWPQLPFLGPREGMTLQYVSGFPGLRELNGNTVVDNGEDGHAELEGFYEKLLSGDPEAFGLPPERSKGFPAFLAALEKGAARKARYLKGHVTGPVTLASSLKDCEGREITHDIAFREAVSAILAANARWQVKKLGAFGRRVIVFLDEPVMEVFGSAYSTLDRQTVESLWKPVLDAIREEGALSGVHCCGNTDWGLLLGSGFDIVNFDAYQYVEKMTLYAAEAAAFMGRGGALAWGIVPTDGRAVNETPESLLAKLEEGMARFESRGVDGELLRRMCVITPSCGMGSLTVELSERILGLLTDTSALFSKRRAAP